MNGNDLSIASGDLTNSYPGPFQLFAGDADVITMPETVAQSGTVIPQYSPLTRDGISGMYRLAATGEKVTAIAPYAIDSTGGDLVFPLYKAGYFNTKAIAWPASFADELSKRVATDGTPIFHRDIITPQAVVNA